MSFFGAVPFYCTNAASLPRLSVFLNRAIAVPATPAPSGFFPGKWSLSADYCLFAQPRVFSPTMQGPEGGIIRRFPNVSLVSFIFNNFFLPLS